MTSWRPQGVDRPGYQALVASLQQDIQSGRLRAGERLPAIRQLAQQLAVNPTTVARAYRDVRLVSIGGGADEIMLGIICKLMGILPGKKK